MNKFNLEFLEFQFGGDFPSDLTGSALKKDIESVEINSDGEITVSVRALGISIKRSFKLNEKNRLVGILIPSLGGHYDTIDCEVVDNVILLSCRATIPEKERESFVIIDLDGNVKMEGSCDFIKYYDMLDTNRLEGVLGIYNDRR